MPLQKQIAGSLLSGAGDDRVLQSLPKELLQCLLMKCCLEAFATALTKEMISFFFSSVEKHEAGNCMAEACYCVTLSPNNLAPARSCLLIGTGPTMHPRGKVHRKNCPFSHSLQAKGDDVFLSGFSIAEGVSRDPRINLHCFRAGRRSCFGPFFQDLYQSAFAVEQTTLKLDSLRK